MTIVCDRIHGPGVQGDDLAPHSTLNNTSVATTGLLIKIRPYGKLSEGTQFSRNFHSVKFGTLTSSQQQRARWTSQHTSQKLLSTIGTKQK